MTAFFTLQMHRSLDVDGTCADQKSFVRGGPSLIRFYFRGERLQRHPKRGQLSACQRNAIEMAFCWRADNGQPFNADLAAFGFSGDPNHHY